MIKLSIALDNRLMSAAVKKELDAVPIILIFRYFLLVLALKSRFGGAKPILEAIRRMKKALY